MKVKGSALKARVRWVQEKGPPAMERFLEALRPETRGAVRAGFMVHEWYPFADFLDVNEVIDRQFGKGDLALCRDLGRYSCDVNLNTIYKVLIRFGSVGFIIQRAATAWRVNYDEGRIEILENTPARVRLRICDVPAPHRAHCLSVVGWIVRAAELSGATVTDEEERCRCLGNPECELAFSFE